MIPILIQLAVLQCCWVSLYIKSYILITPKISFMIFSQLQIVSKEFAEDRVDNSFNRSQPWVMCYVDKEGTDEYQLFVVVDRRILMEVESSSFSRALFIFFIIFFI